MTTFWDQVKADVGAIASADGPFVDAVITVKDTGATINTKVIEQPGQDMAAVESGQARNQMISVLTSARSRMDVYDEISIAGTVWVWQQTISANAALITGLCISDHRAGR